MNTMERGYVQIYTGEGKGKSTACFGLALRACGAGHKVYIGQFMKNGDYSEIKSLKKLGVTVDQYGTGGELFDYDPVRDKQSAQAGYSRAKEALANGGYDVFILDEINVAVKMEYLTEADVKELVRIKPVCTELVLSGRGATKAMQELADLVTYMQEIKHYYKDGVMAREGIED